MVTVHVLLATLLAAVVATLSPLYWLIAFVALYPIFRLCGLFHHASRLYALRIEAGLGFVPWFTYQIFRASLDVAKIVLNPRYQIEPAVVRVPVHSRDKRLITLLGCLLTLTPGTLALDYRATTGDMFVHVLDTRSADAVIAAIGEIERRLLRWVQPLGAET
ncbi:cation:proton antiporter [Halopseudomonas laoshanensis]|uniref:Cation:proton antiporter n=1 Tax=Halopseudomonas laoshanensis TaxID=2268758 RepID=A0A7V7KXK4_9GAMM|nr:Na+/H+ antiporter subunit E [Halopseudomonas laoshanensis]KAA0694756.1 cation:proton antiporter [Halopseudomonas laoshanensis]